MMYFLSAEDALETLTCSCGPDVAGSPMQVQAEEFLIRVLEYYDTEGRVMEGSGVRACEELERLFPDVKHPSFWILLWTLDGMNLISHGGNVLAGWLEPVGVELLALLRQRRREREMPQ